MLAYELQKADMALRKADTDISQTTLAALPGLWRKLLYFARLRRNPSGTYQHWGIEQKYGVEGKRALADAHGKIFTDALQTSVEELLRDAQDNGAAEELTRLESIETMIPLDPKTGSRRHFSSVITAVRELLKVKRPAPPAE